MQTRFLVSLESRELVKRIVELRVANLEVVMFRIG